jgi:hypothetical protein
MHFTRAHPRPTASFKHQQVGFDNPATPTEMLSGSQVHKRLIHNQEFLDCRLGLLYFLCSNYSDNGRERQRPSSLPERLTTPCEDLYTLIDPCLVKNNPKSNTSSLPVGKRGMEHMPSFQVNWKAK